jgi:hypothetical protein
MARSLSYFDSHFFGLMYLLFHSLIPFNNGFGNYTRLRVSLSYLFSIQGFCRGKVSEIFIIN